MVQLSRKGKVLIEVVGSASKVPTRSFRGNKQLASSRATKTRKDLVEAVRQQKGNPTNLSFRQRSAVNGPEYMGDWNIGRKKYEAHQYSKARVVK